MRRVPNRTEGEHWAAYIHAVALWYRRNNVPPSLAMSSVMNEHRNKPAPGPDWLDSVSEDSSTARSMRGYLGRLP